ESGQGIKAAEAADSALLLHRELGRKQWLLEALLSTARSKVAACKEHEENGAESAEIEKEVLSALDMAREAVGMSRRMNDAQSLIFCQHTEVEVLVAMNQFDEAMDVLKEAVALSQEQQLLREEGRLTSDV
ncbi:Gpsm2, partial [Symbiodinium sp. KB8]